MQMTNPLILCDVATLLSPRVSREDIFNSLFNLVNRMIPFSSATLYTFSDKDERLVPLFQHGDEPVDLARNFQFKNGPGITGWISTQNYPIIFPTLKNSKWSKRSTFNSMVSIPLKYNRTPIGVLNLGHVEKNTYQAEYREDYLYLGRQISLILVHLIHENHINETAPETMNQQNSPYVLSQTLDKTIRRPIATMLELIDILSLSLPTGNLDRIKTGIDAIRDELLKISRLTEQNNGSYQPSSAAQL